MRFSAWTASLLPSIVRFWNRSFSARRNFVPVTERLFAERVSTRRGSFERFDPSGFIVAREQGEIAGFIHVAERPERVCRALDPEWRGGRQGYVAFLYVDPGRRRKGLGTELWHRGLERLKRTRQVVLDGQCFNPFYGNSEGPVTPLWGTPEGIGVDWNDSATKKFLARKGFAPRFKGVQLEIDLGRAPAPSDDPARALARQGIALEVFREVYPRVGRNRREQRPLPPGLEYEVVAAIHRGRVLGLISFYPMREARPGLVGIYEAVVVESQRGKALGRRLLQGAVDRMRAGGAASCEVLTLPELSPSATRLYLQAGFQPAQNWAIY